MKKDLHYIALALAFIFLMGCTDGYEKIVPGLRVKKLSQGNGRGMESGTDYFYLQVQLMSNDDKLLEHEGFNPTFIYLAQVNKPSYTYDFIQYIPGVKKGDSLSFDSQADSLFLYYYGINKPTWIEGENVHVHVKVDNILSEAEYYEKLEQARTESKNRAYEEFEAYMREHAIAETPIGTGTIKITKKEGSGPNPTYGSAVSIHMIQRTFGGTEIENSYKAGSPFEYEIGSPNGLKGLDEALVKMKKGEKATVYLPYFLAFGEAGLPPNIPPYTNIMMELELLDLK